MFSQSWYWAGKFRNSTKNIGYDWHKIPEAIKNLCDDTQCQIERNTYESDEIAIRFHHNLTFIHAFPNGNGHHARIAANILITTKNYKKYIF
jgi:fido (protein-threonine AMPylation protein)